MREARKDTFGNTKKDALSESKLRMSLDYIFGRGTGRKLDYSGLEYQYSRKTGRLRYVVDNTSKQILFTLRPNGSIAPTVQGAIALLGKPSSIEKSRPRWTITVLDGVSELVSEGKTVFCKHVVACDDSLRSGEDVVILNEEGELLAVGRTILPGPLMKQFKRGAAVKVREGISHRGSNEPGQ